LKIKHSILAIITIVIVFSLVGCVNSSTPNVSGNTLFNTPDKINLYVNGKQKLIVKNSDKTEQALFDRINALIDIKIPKELFVVKSAFSEDDIKEAKEYSVEFIYSSIQTQNISNENEVQIQFTKVYFPLDEKWENIALIEMNDGSYIPIELMEDLDTFVKAAVQ
jgi:hypothetical protein